MGRFDGKVVLLTGAGQGLGASAMKLFAREGATVIGTARRDAKVQAVIEELKAEGDYELLALHQDVSLREDWEKVVSTAVERSTGRSISWSTMRPR